MDEHLIKLLVALGHWGQYSETPTPDATQTPAPNATQTPAPNATQTPDASEHDDAPPRWNFRFE